MEVVEKGEAQGSRRPPLLKASPLPGRQSGRRLGPPRWVYLFYDHYPMCEWTHSLYKIDLDRDGVAAADLSPVAKFPNNGEFPTGMRCARLDSKLHILGGVVPGVADEEYNPDSDYDVDVVFPRDVYVLDMVNCGGGGGELMKLGAKLNTAKPCPCAFTANGKLFALGSLYCSPVISSWELINLSKQLASIKPSFECFDPSTNKWHVLADPPLVDKHAQWLECTVFENHQQVELVAWEFSRGRSVRLIYDLRLGEWTRDQSRHIDVSLKFQEGGGHHLYGLRPRPYGLPFKLTSGRPVAFEDEMALSGTCTGLQLRQGLVEMSNNEPTPTPGWEHIFLSVPYVDCISRLLLYAGNGYFCYLVSGAPPHPKGRDHWGYLPPDNQTRAITITVFKEINDDKNSSDESFKAVILRSQEYCMKTPFYSMGELVGCFVVGPEQQHNVQVMQKI